MTGLEHLAAQAAGWAVVAACAAAGVMSARTHAPKKKPRRARRGRQKEHRP